MLAPERVPTRGMGWRRVDGKAVRGAASVRCFKTEETSTAHSQVPHPQPHFPFGTAIADTQPYGREAREEMAEEGGVYRTSLCCLDLESNSIHCDIRGLN